MARGHAINVPDFIESLKICNLATISVQKADRTGVMQASIFPLLLIVSREGWLKQPRQARCYVQFNPLITASIDRLTYRQFDYLTYMSYKHRLSRWLHKRLSHNYTQAGLLHPYTIRMSTILRDSGLPQKERGNDNAREVEKTLQELKDKRVLMTFDKEILRPRYKIIDIKIPCGWTWTLSTKRKRRIPGRYVYQKRCQGEQSYPVHRLILKTELVLTEPKLDKR